jgi:Zn-dependent peptidase ImmA (M78 family)
MKTAVQTAEGIYAKFGNDLERIISELGLIVLEEELAGRLSEVYFGDAIVVRRDLPRAVKRELIAHAIGHHLMHAGNHLTLQDHTYSFGNYHEKQANVFAAWLLVPEHTLTKKLEAGRSVPDLAHDFGVTDELMLFRLQIRHLTSYGVKHKSAGQDHKVVDGS